MAENSVSYLIEYQERVRQQNELGKSFKEHGGGNGGGGNMEQRVQALEKEVSDLGKGVAWIKGTLEAVLPTLATKGDVQAIQAVLPSLATKDDVAKVESNVAKVESKLIKWAVMAIITASGAAAAIVFGIVSKAPTVPPNITIHVPPVSAPATTPAPASVQAEPKR